MNSEFIKMIASQGAFAALFCYLLVYVLKENNLRETSYEELVKELAKGLPSIEEKLNDISNKLK
ncbi:bacteriocin [Clostridium botulinum]|uniref:BhlA/UviB family holin-like peptide n=1 Tax=Clostridium botulinum TaxID=1491 RepID=UPI001C9BB579|nr:BhlA/UviB family holin-like peptide [Clostridium botulinum]MBY6889335.1 bacteriocin [Clostridium botulinum]